MTNGRRLLEVDLKGVEADRAKREEEGEFLTSSSYD
jgi:hypothetical protein